jgi:hypothetical protein
MEPVATAATPIADHAANGCAWADPIAHHAQPTNVRALAQAQCAGLAAHAQQDDKPCGACDVHGVETPAAGATDRTPSGPQGLADALDQADSVQQALLLLGRAAVALCNNPADQALHSAALRAVDKARGRLLGHGLLLRQVQPGAAGNRFAELAAALDLAEFSIQMPQRHREQRMWRLKAHWLAGHMAARDKAQGQAQEWAQRSAQLRAQLRAQASVESLNPV